jgi:hypothetical protein
MPKYLIPMRQLYYALIFAGIFVIYLLFRANLKYHFIIYNDEGDKIVFRHYPLSSFQSKYVSIEIPFNALYKIEINKVFFGFREELTIYQTTKEGVAKYKPVPLTALTKKEKEQLLQSMNNHARVKMQ